MNSPLVLYDPKRAGFYLLLVLLLIGNLAADRVTKLAAEVWLAGREPIGFFFDSVVLVFARNSGAFLGMGADWPEPLKWVVLLVIPGLFCLYGLGWCWFKETDRLRLTAIACLVAGGTGNLFDRAFLNFEVVDFLNFGLGPVRSGIVNVADLSVTFGALLLIWTTRKPSEKGS